MKSKALIIDDEERNRSLLKQLLQDYCSSVEVIGFSDSVSSGFKNIQALKPDLVFLDIRMEDGSGFDLLDMLGDFSFQVIFVTAYQEFAVRAFKYAAIDYLLKPIGPSDLINAVRKAAQKIDQSSYLLQLKALLQNIHSNNTSISNQQLALPTMDGLDIVKIEDIVHCEANRSYCYVHRTSNDKLLVSKSLSEIEDVISNETFIRIHKSHLVNLHHVSKYVKGSGGYVIMSNGQHLDVSQRRKEIFLSRLRNIRA